MKVHPLLVVSIIVGLPLTAQAVSRPADDIPALIEQLVEVESPQTFYAGTFRFTEFPPLDEAPLRALPLPANTSPAEASFRALIRLIELGPEALPLLLEHLDDKRETRTLVTDEYATSMGPSAFVDFRPGDPRDEFAIEKTGLPKSNPGPDFDEMIKDYTLTVGDMCFALIGMITNRSYYIVVDEFDAQLNSPTHSERIAIAVREKWGVAPERVELYTQLKMDLEQGQPRYAEAAARRLLYYFPGHSDQLVIAHLGKLMKAHDPGSDELADFLKAISWSPDPRIKSTLRRFLCTATDATQISAAATVYGNSPDPRGHEQLLQLADKLKLRRDPGHVKASRMILGLNMRSFPDKREETVRRFLKGAGAYANTSACLVCEGIEGAPLAALAPLLKLTSRSTGERYLIKGEGAEKWPEDDDFLPYRICDRAYETISRLLGDKATLAVGSRKAMDDKIENLRERLAGKSKSWTFRASEIEIRQKVQNKHRANN